MRKTSFSGTWFRCNLRQGKTHFALGDVASNYLVVKSGSVRVVVTTEQGREIVLYHVEQGQTCVLTTSCLLSGSAYDAEAVADVDTEAIILPKAAFEEIMAAFAQIPAVRVFLLWRQACTPLSGLCRKVAIKHVDRRLARLLVQRAQDGVVAATHQALAQELNTAREVVTRLLNDFSEQGWLETARGTHRAEGHGRAGKTFERNVTRSQTDGRQSFYCLVMAVQPPEQSKLENVMTKNVGSIDRVLRVILGVALLAFAFLSGHQYAWIGYLGVVPLLTAALGNCPLYSILGLSTCPVKRA